MVAIMAAKYKFFGSLIACEFLIVFKTEEIDD